MGAEAAAYLYDPTRTTEPSKKRSRVAAFEYDSVWNAMRRSSLSPEEFWEKRFKPDADTLAKESSHVEIDSYPDYEMVFDVDGLCTLMPIGYARPLRDVVDPDGSLQKDWSSERREGINYTRHKIEAAAIVAFEEELAIARAEGTLKDGDTYIWSSPPPTSILLDPELSEEERLQALGELGYDYHSCTHVYTVVGDSLQPHVVQSYLHPREHTAFIAEAVGPGAEIPFPNDISILGKIHKVENPDLADPQAIKERIRELYKQTPEDRKIIPPEASEDSELGGLREVEEAEAALKTTEKMLLYSYWALRFMTQHDTQNKAQRAKMDTTFQAWRKAYYLVLNGGELPEGLQEQLDAFNQLPDDQIKEAARELIRGPSSGVARGSGSAASVGRMVSSFSGISTPEMRTGCGVNAGWTSTESSLSVLAGGHRGDIARKAQDPCLSSSEKAAGLRILRALKINDTHIKSPIPCPGCGSCPTICIADVKDKGVIDCCSKENGARGKMTNPYAIIMLLSAATK